MKDLVLSTSFGFSRSDLEPFLRSLKETDFPGDIVFFTGNTTIETNDWLKSEGVNVLPLFYPFGKWDRMRNPLHYAWPFARPLVSWIKNPDVLSWVCAPFQNLTTLRFLLYHRFLRSTENQYRFVLLTDLRDVYFQANPFSRAEPGQLRVFAEDASRTLGTCPFNSRWIRDALGRETLDKVADKPIVCAGTTLGDSASVLRYLDAFVLTIAKARSLMRVGSDQGIHNFLVHTKLAGSVTPSPNGASEVLTMGYMPPDEHFRRNDIGALVDSSGVPYSILHQYDRHEGLTREIRGRSRFTRPAIR